MSMEIIENMINPVTINIIMVLEQGRCLFPNATRAFLELMFNNYLNTHNLPGKRGNKGVSRIFERGGVQYLLVL